MREYWIIDPEFQEAEFYFLDGTGRFRPLLLDGSRLQSRAIQGFWMDVDWLWQDPRPKLVEICQAWGI